MPTTTSSMREDAALRFFTKPAGSFAPELANAFREGVCTSCQGEALDFRDDLSLREWGISGLCQSCQDAIFGGDDE